MREYLFTSESVSEGHPDKVADQISDAILDAALTVDPEARVACETLVTKNLVVVAGEFRTDHDIPLESIVRETVRLIGYTGTDLGFDAESLEVISRVGRQSQDIARGVERGGGELGAGDQGLMFGYACRETLTHMPLPIMLAHRLVQRQSLLRKSGEIPWLRPDAKSQVTVRYRGLNPISVERVVFSTQHSALVKIDELRDAVTSEIIEQVIPKELRSSGITYLVNPTGRFVIGGPAGDAGLTGRKIIVDTYGGSAPHGGGAFSGKDPTKVDRSAAYAARYIAKNIVAAGFAERCTIQLSYAIGTVDPISLMVDFHGTGCVKEENVERVIPEVFPITPRAIIETLELRRPIYKKTAAYGHFGRNLPEFTWERTDKVGDLRQALGFQ